MRGSNSPRSTGSDSGSAVAAGAWGVGMHGGAGPGPAAASMRARSRSSGNAQQHAAAKPDAAVRPRKGRLMCYCMRRERRSKQKKAC